MSRIDPYAPQPKGQRPPQGVAPILRPGPVQVFAQPQPQQNRPYQYKPPGAERVVRGRSRAPQGPQPYKVRIPNTDFFKTVYPPGSKRPDPPAPAETLLPPVSPIAPPAIPVPELPVSESQAFEIPEPAPELPKELDLLPAPAAIENMGKKKLAQLALRCTPPLTLDLDKPVSALRKQVRTALYGLVQD